MQLVHSEAKPEKSMQDSLFIGLFGFMAQPSYEPAFSRGKKKKFR